MRHLSLTLLALALMHAAEPAPAPATQPPAAVDSVPLPPNPPELDPAVADLRGRLPQVPCVVERDGRLWWQGQDATVAVPFSGIDDRRQPQVDTACGRVTVSRRLVEDGRIDALRALITLAPLAKTAELADLRLAEGPLTGVHLRGKDAIVLAGGVLRQVETAAADRGNDLRDLRTLIDQARTELPALDMDETGRRALGAVLGKLATSEHSGELDDASPEFCRRVVRSGWLRRFFPTHATDERIETAVRTAETPRPVQRWSGPGGDLAQVRDAFGKETWILRSAARSAWMTGHPEPIYFGGWPALRLVVETDPGADPLDPACTVRGARTWRQVDADWIAVAELADGKAVECFPGAWARAVPRRNRSPNVADWLPVHILVTSPLGDVISLAAAGGSVAPPKDGTQAEGERFLAEAARALPDATHLDLIGQHLLRYVYDSPDPRHPILIGNKTDKGDIHQTALQTLSTAAGGMIRGDCDDLAELFETLAERQGRTAHVIGVPGHAACAWAEKRSDSWHVFILQTGPALEFVDADLKLALGKAYKHFDESDTFDPNGLGLLLRFTDENQRGSWRLSYRVFSDPEYARIMIDVQKDWHFSTYQRGIAKMRKLIDSSPDEAKETANYRELSGLYSFTGQYALAAEHHQKAIELTADDKVSSLYMDIELVGHLFDAGKTHRAREVAIDLLERQIPAQEAKLGPAIMQVATQLAGILASHEARDLALRALRPGIVQFNARLGEVLGRKNGARPGKVADAQHPVAGLNALGDWLEGPDFDQNTWDNHPALQQFRRLSQYLASTAISCLEHAAPAELTSDADLQLAARFTQVWLDRVAFRDIDDPGEALSRYAIAGRAYAPLLGSERLQSLLDSAPPPASLEAAPARRIGGIAQVTLDAGWIRVSPTYWSGRLMELFERDRDAFDPALAASLAKQALEASAKIAGSPLEDPRSALQTHLVGLIQALLAKDEAALRQRLRVVAQRKDKDWYDETARWIGDTARRLDLPWYKTVLKCWNSEVHYESKYFWIAWRAALGKAPKHALLAAELAVAEYPRNPAFLEELEFMRQVLAETPAR